MSRDLKWERYKIPANLLIKAARIPFKTERHTGFLNDLLLKSANVDLKIKACKHNKFDGSPALYSGNLWTSPL